MVTKAPYLSTWMKFDWWKHWKAAIGKYTAIHFRREAPPTAIDAHESYEVIKGLIAEALRGCKLQSV